MVLLDRVWRVAWLHGYRVGLQLGEHGYCVLTVRDPMQQRRVIAIISRTIDESATQLLVRMVQDDWVPADYESQL